MLLWPTPTHAETREIIFPVIGTTRYSDDFGDPRDTGNRVHEGNDIFGSKGMPLVAAASGTVRYVPFPEPDYGYYVSIQDEDGYSYVYIHINDDTPGTDDGLGGGRNAYAPYMERGNSVVAGQLIGWMGDSGNAESTTPHLHFEIRDPEGNPINPFDSLNGAVHVTSVAQAPQLEDEILPYGEFTGGTFITMGNVDADEDLELITGAGPGGGSNVRVFDQDGTLLSGFFAYDSGFKGGVDVTTGDTNGDGVDEIITAAGPGGGPQVRIFNKSGKVLGSFFAYDQSFRGGVNVSAGDVTGDNKAEIIVGPGAGGGPQVRVLRSDGRYLYQFMAYDENFTGGVDVAVRPVKGERKPRIVTAPGPGGSPEIRVFRTNGELIRKFFAYDTGFTGGVRLDVDNVNTDSAATEIVTVPASRGGVDIRIFRLQGRFVGAATEFEEWWTGGFDVAVGENDIFVGTGPTGRRASVKEAY